MVEIAAHFLQINGASKTLVLSMKQSIHDRHFRLASPLVMGFVVPEPVDIRFSIIVPLVPAYFAIIGNGKGPAVLKGYLLHQHFLKLRNDNIFILFFVHECQGVMVLHHYETRAKPPYAEHGTVHNVREGALRVISNTLSLCRWIVTSAKEPPFASSKCNKESTSLKFTIGPLMPSLRSRKSSKILGLESND